MLQRIALVLTGLALAAATAVALAGEPLVVFVSVPPQRIFVERIGGARVAVHALVQPGSNPHAYEPTPRQIAALEQADLYVRIGDRFEDAWLPRIQGAHPRLRVLDARDGIPPRIDHDHDHDHGQGDMPDTHIWTSPPLVKIMGAGIRDALGALAPAHAAEFAARYEAFAADLDALDAAIRVRLDGARGRAFLVQHPAWGYFADTYGLRQIAIEQAGKEPGARALAALIAEARALDARVVFTQPQFSPRAAEQVARAIGARVEPLDPLDPDYFASLRRAAERIAGTEAP